MEKCIKRGFIKIHPNIFIMKSFNTSEPFGNFEVMDLTVGINLIEGNICRINNQHGNF